LPGEPDLCCWEPLSPHLANVGRCSGAFADVFGWRAVGDLAGRLHDIGKCSAEFQQLPTTSAFGRISLVIDPWVAAF